ncbi:MAG: prolipoprotein diacylglyceryl transferase [Clostridiales bacterium]|nr:prolipoprotein diacylglyceryl transferase [Clostridiales bacterium]
MFGFYDKYFLLFGLNISYYGFLIAVGMGIGVFIACKLAKFRGLKTEDILVLACYVLPLSVLGARIYYVLFSGQTYDFWEVFAIWEGGMAIYGGVIGGAIGVGLYCLIHKKNFFDLADVAVAPLLFGQGIGRIGCFFSKCCYGIEITNPSMQWFPLCTQINGDWHLSTFFFESFFDLLLCIVFIILICKKVRTRGIMMSLYFIFYGTVRCVIETFRGDSLMLGSVKVSQLLSGLLIVAGVVFLIIFLILKHKRQKIIA